MKNLDGVLLLDKPQGITSNKTLQKVKRLFQAKKAGHTGSLDPLATGMLPICFGQATKYSQFLLDADKTYLTTGTLGVKTTTSDSDGDICEQKDPGHVTRDKIEEVLDDFVGESRQIPSMYSALKHKGQPLYKLARLGIEVERKARRIHIYSIELVDVDLPRFTLKVHSSKGTYIRNLVEDIGERLGVGAHVSALRRLYTSPYEQNTMHEFSALEELENREQVLLPIDSMLGHLKKLVLNEEEAGSLRFGRHVTLEGTGRAELVCLADSEGNFIGVGEVTELGILKAKRLLAS